MPGQPTPGGEIFGYARIAGRQLQDLPGTHRLEPYAQLEYQLATAHIASIPLAMRGRSIELSQGSIDELVIRMALLYAHSLDILVHVWLPSYRSACNRLSLGESAASS
jgi:hypothetical protein